MVKKNPPDKHYLVGRGRPPESTQFKPGQSGNPRGRPRGGKDISSYLARDGQRKVKVQENGRSKSMAKNDIAARKLMNKANQGDLHAIALVMKENAKLAQETSASAIQAPPYEMTPEAMLRAAKRFIQDAEEGETEEGESGEGK